MRPRLLSPIISVLAGTMLLTSCAAVTARKTEVETVVQKESTTALGGSTLSPSTVQYLRMHDLTTASRAEPDAVIERLSQPFDPDDPADRICALTETAIFRAQELEKAGDPKALQWYATAARASFQALLGAEEILPRADYRRSTMRLFYARAVAGVATLMRRNGNYQPQTIVTGGQPLTLSLETGAGLVDPREFSEMRLAVKFDFEGLTNRHRRPGFGISFVGIRPNNHRTVQERYFTPSGIYQGVTALLVFSEESGGQSAQLRFYDSASTDETSIGQKIFPLAADLTAPLGVAVSRTSLKSVNISATMNVEDTLEYAGFYMLEPFDPDKIPLITVHGLLSSPITWINLQNDLMADPVIRKKFQIWHFYYPPGLPVLFSARIFREKIDQLFKDFDPAGTNENLHSAVIIAHSMGGLLTRTISADSEERLWLRFFGKKKEDIAIDPDVRTELDSLLDFRPRPFVKRVIFCAVPHRGAEMAQSFSGRIGNALISLPAAMLGRIHQIFSRIRPFVKGEVSTAFEEANPGSISSLRPDNPTLEVMAQLAIARGIAYHSIIGDRGKGDTPNSSDGVVPYWSSHLDGAASELIVPTDHSVHNHPLAVLEIRRILRLHLQSLQTPGTTTTPATQKAKKRS